MSDEKHSLHPARNPHVHRVFTDVAMAPRSPESRIWNHPLVFLVAGTLGATFLNTAPEVPAGAGGMFFLLAIALAAASVINGFMWRISRTKALDEAVWVARQSGYRIDANEGGQLKWLDSDGRIKVAYLISDRGSWDVVLRSDLVYAQAKVS